MSFIWPLGCFAVHKLSLSDQIKTAVISRKLSFVLIVVRSDGTELYRSHLAGVLLSSTFMIRYSVSKVDSRMTSPPCDICYLLFFIVNWGLSRVYGGIMLQEVNSSGIAT